MPASASQFLSSWMPNLRRLARPRIAAAPAERCELCSAPLGLGHEHLLELPSRQITCACGSCAILFGGQNAGRYRRVPQRVERVGDVFSDQQWLALGLPIDLAFFVSHESPGRVTAAYPSPAGATESLLSLDAWQDLLRAAPQLTNLQPEVEALLVNRTGEHRDAFRVPIDECFRLVGIIRKFWRGFSGGAEAHERIDDFFEQLAIRCPPADGRDA